MASSRVTVFGGSGFLGRQIVKRLAADAPEADLVRLARESERVREHIDGRQVVKEIVVPGKLVNLVVR